MLPPAQFRPLPLPLGWPHRVHSAVVQVISLARTSLTLARGWASESMNPELRQQAEEDRLRQEIQLLREEVRIKDARMEQLEAHRRLHYQPTARLAILELRAARGWSLARPNLPGQLPHHRIVDGTPGRAGSGLSRQAAHSREQVPRLRRLSRETTANPLPVLAKCQDRPDPCSGRPPHRANNRAEDGGGLATTEASPRSPEGRTGRYIPASQPGMARRLDDRSHRPGVLDSVDSLRQTTGLAVLLVARRGSRSLLAAGHGIRGLSWGAFLCGDSGIPGDSVQEGGPTAWTPDLRPGRSVHR